MINKKNIPLYIALAIPVLMIILVAAFIYLPGVGKSPHYNFLYISGNNIYYYDYGAGGYNVVNNRLVYNPPPVNNNNYYPNQNQNNDQPHFYLYDTARQEATEVSLSQAQSYNLDPTTSSPDGYTVQQGNGGGGDLFFGGPSDYNNWYLKGHNRSQKLNLKTVSQSYGSYNFRFLGWVK